MSDTAMPLPDRDAIRADLEATRQRFHELLDRLSDADWTRPSAGSGWRVRDQMWHMAWGPGAIAAGLQQARRGKGYNPPMWYFNAKNRLRTRWHGRRATPESIAATYDAAHAKLLQLLDDLDEAEWRRSVRRYGADRTIESFFPAVTRHFESHSASVRAALGLD